jgi:hypothetical protein
MRSKDESRVAKLGSNQSELPKIDEELRHARNLQIGVRSSPGR